MKARTTRRMAGVGGLVVAGLASWLVWRSLDPGERGFPPFTSASDVGTVGSNSGGPATWDPRERFFLATEALSTNDREQAHQHAEALSRESGFEPHAELLRAALQMRDQQYERALEGLQRAAEHEELRAQALAYLGEAHVREGRPGNAHQVLNESLRLDPHCIDAHRWLAVLYYDLGAMEYALSHLREVGRLATHDPRPFRLMGLIHKDYEKFEEAAEDYRECLARDPRQLQAGQIYFEWAECEAKLRRYGKALELSQKSDQSVEVLVLRAQCYFGLGRREEGQTCLAEALDADPKNIPALLVRGETALEDGDPEAARDALLLVVEQSPKNDVGHYRLALAYNKLGEPVLAQTHADQAEIWKEKRLKFSEMHMEAVNRPLDAELRVQIGQAALELDRPELAQNWFQAALAINPQHPSAAEGLAKARAAEER